MAKYITGGTIGEIGTTKAAAVLADYTSDTWSAIGEVEDFGEFGPSFNEVTGTAVGDRLVQKFKGSQNNGNVGLVCFTDNRDPGQIALKAAIGSDLDFNFHIKRNDKPTAAGKPTEYYFRAKVMSATNNIGSVDNLGRTTFTLGINSQIIEIPASPT